MFSAGPAQEQTLLNDRGVIVSTARFVVGSTTYPLAGITAVQYLELPAQRGGAILAGIILGSIGGVSMGRTFLPNSDASAVLALLCAVVAAVGFASTVKPNFVVRVMTAGGQIDAIKSPDKTWTQSIATALNQAVINRG